MVLEKCPFEISDNVEWRFYPASNLAGFAALAQDYDETDQTFILVFSHSPKQIGADNASGVEGIKEFDINNINTNDIRLYVKEGDEYVDITPGDFYLETDSSNSRRIGDSDVWVESCRFINLNSHELGEPGEHDYRLVFRDYTIDFTLRIQTFEVW